MKENTALVRVDEVLDYFEIPAANRNLTVLVRYSLIDPARFFGDVSEIEQVKVTKQKITSPVRLSLDLEEEFHNIVSKKYPADKKLTKKAP